MRRLAARGAVKPGVLRSAPGNSQAHGNREWSHPQDKAKIERPDRAPARGGTLARRRPINYIGNSRQDTVRYPEFVTRSTAAGVIGYWAFLTGKKVIGFGRKDELNTVRRG